jgi:hypothetical protein
MSKARSTGQSSLAGLKIKAKVVLFEQGRSRIDLNDQATWDRLSWNERLIFSLIADICAMEG